MAPPRLLAARQGECNGARPAGPDVKEERMNVAETSLRMLVEKWLALGTATPVRVTRFGRTRLNRMRCVCVEALRPEGLVAIFFFRHRDGAWRIFPPESERLAMRIR